MRSPLGEAPKVGEPQTGRLSGLGEGVSVLQDEEGLETDGGSGCTTLCLQMAKMVNWRLCVFATMTNFLKTCLGNFGAA